MLCAALRIKVQEVRILTSVLTWTYEAEQSGKQCTAPIKPSEQVWRDRQHQTAGGCHTSVYFCQTPADKPKVQNQVITVCCVNEMYWKHLQ